jgi:hypothetical protein
MNIRSCIFPILLAILVFPGSVFAENRNMTADEYMKMLGAESASRVLPLTPKDDKLGEPNNGLAKLAKDDKWGEPDNGFITQLIPQNEEYIVGKPMKFGLVLKNISNTAKSYDHQAITHNTLIIKNPENNEPYYKVGCFQTVGGPHPIDKGEIAILFEKRNITNEYVIIKPGQYTIQFRGGIYGMAPDSNFPPSNIIEFEVKPGTPDEHDLLISSLVGILPEKCWQAATVSRYNAPSGRKDAEGISIILIRNAHLISDVIIARLWKTKSPAEIVKQEKDAKTSEYLGKNDKGYFYIEIQPKALEYWPKMKEDIIKTLKIDSQSEQKP